jgi:uncharacterized protein DUF4136
MRPLRFASIVGVVWATLVLAGCATMRVGSFVERGTNLTAYRTYAWASDAQLSTGDPRLDNNEFFQARLQAAVEKGLGARGLEKAESGQADFVLHYHASMTQKVDAGGVDAKYGYCEDCRPSVFDAGTLTLDVVDARTNKLAWRGWAQSTFDGVVDNQQWLERRIDESVGRILRTFPVRTGL